MAWAPRKAKWPWRNFLTTEEAAVVARADRRIEELRAELRELSQKRAPIVNRAIHRAKYEAKP